MSLFCLQVNRMMVYDPDLLPDPIPVNWTEISANTMALVETVSRMNVSDLPNMLLPVIPGMDSQQMEKQIQEMINNIENMDVNSLMM